MTPLDKTLKRSLKLNGVDYVVSLSPQSIKITRKGRRLGVELTWEGLTSGESALAVALHASIGKFSDPEMKAPLADGARKRASVHKATMSKSPSATLGRRAGIRSASPSPGRSASRSSSRPSDRPAKRAGKGRARADE